jgi:hypothetical protein
MAASALDIDALRKGATPTRGEMAKIVIALSMPAILAELDMSGFSLIL